jgi:hypothetical protein
MTFVLSQRKVAFTNVFAQFSRFCENRRDYHEYLRLPSINTKKLPIVLSKSEVCGNVSMRKVTQAQNPYWFTLWLWSV